MFMCVVNQKSVNKLDLTWKQSFLILTYFRAHLPCHLSPHNTLYCFHVMTRATPGNPSLYFEINCQECKNCINVVNGRF